MAMSPASWNMGFAPNLNRDVGLCKVLGAPCRPRTRFSECLVCRKCELLYQMLSSYYDRMDRKSMRTRFGPMIPNPYKGE
jgi:hypothetical protein